MRKAKPVAPPSPPIEAIPAVLYSLLGGKYLVRLTNKAARPGERSGAVLDAAGNVIGNASDYIYGGRGFAVHTKPFGGFVPSEQIVFFHELQGK
jgi:hypothetical protein